MTKGFGLFSALFGAGLISFAALAAPVSENSQATVTVHEVDFSKKPPYPRKVVSVRVEDVAQFERVNGAKNAAEFAEVKTVNFSGKPPFKRTTERLQVIDAAQFETVEEDKPQRQGSRPPFKRH